MCQWQHGFFKLHVFIGTSVLKGLTDLSKSQLTEHILNLVLEHLFVLPFL